MNIDHYKPLKSLPSTIPFYRGMGEIGLFLLFINYLFVTIQVIIRGAPFLYSETLKNQFH